MKRIGSLEVRLFKTTWFHVGYNWRRVAIGISVDRWGINIDFGPFWFNLEL